MAARPELAIDIGRRHLRALQAARGRGRLVVSRVLVEPIPPDLDRGDPRALGAWVGRALSAAGFSKARAAVAISREHVVLKRMTLPTADPRELPEMTRLALRRQLPFDPQTAVIDFIEVSRGASSSTVLAVAAPHDVLSGVRQAAGSAGLGLERISLRSMGSAALCAGLSAEDDAAPGGAVLVVDVTGERVDFSVVDEGVIRFSRAGELPEIDDAQKMADAVMTEARRTWMSYRIVEEADGVRRAVVLGDRRVGRLVAESIGDVLKVPATVLEAHPLVDARMGGDDLGEAWPLAGLLLGPESSGAAIDFAHPRRAPDIAARRRSLALAGLGAAVVLCGAGVTAARLDLAEINLRVARLESQRGAARPAYYRYGRDRYRLEHLERWETAAPDWLAHLEYVTSLSPPSQQLVLDEFTGDLGFGGVEFDSPTSAFSAPVEIRIVLEGEAADRAAADEYRGRLVGTEAYAISTAGPDAQAGKRLACGFRYQLRGGATRPGGAP